jgi:hypothetical protein
MDYYLTFGLGFYTAASLFNLHTFKSATPMSVLRGLLLGVLLWPIGVIVILGLSYQGRNEKNP